MLKQNKLSPFAIVLLLSIVFGCLQSFLGPITFSDAIEHGQVLSGKVACTNEINASIQVTIKDGKLLLAKDWNAYATLSKDGKELRWNNGAIWTR